MVTLKQIEQLDERVRKAIGVIESLRHEKAGLLAEIRRLTEENQRLEYHLQESERRSLALSGVQEMLEKGLMGAIDRLDSVSGESGVAGQENTLTAGKASASKGGHREEDDPNAGLEALLVKEPDAEENHEKNDHDAEESVRLEERKMDIF